MNADDFAELTAGSQTLKRDWRGDRVLLASDGRIVKLFRHKRLLTSNRIWPYASRFAANAGRLADLGIRAARVDGVFHCSSQKADVVVYPRLEGEPMRTRLAGGDPVDALLGRLPAFVAELHDKGIHFRALHLGNVMCEDHEPLGLIDVQYMRFYRKPLSWRLRIRNLLHLLGEAKDRQVLEAYGFDRFVAEYLDHWGMGHDERSDFVRRLRSAARAVPPLADACDRLLRTAPGTAAGESVGHVR
jgi:tRNA A-37 threonylcarbamoyl transferase component Bud32